MVGPSVYEPRRSKIGSSKEIVGECKYCTVKLGLTLGWSLSCETKACVVQAWKLYAHHFKNVGNINNIGT